MFNEKRLMFLLCESPLHAGSGSELDFIDNPIQRERHTNFPKLESSSLKGAIRERFNAGSVALTVPAGSSSLAGDLFAAAFGSDGSKKQATNEERQGGLAFTDARLLLFPVKSMKGVFVWITCPFVLKRFEADMQRAGKPFLLPPEPEKYTPAKDKAIVFSTDKIEVKTGLTQPQKSNIILEEYAFEKQPADTTLLIEGQYLNDWFAEKIFFDAHLSYWKEQLKNNLVIVSDNDFADFTEMSTEVITRNQIDAATGTVKNGHLFTEEYLPTDSVLYTIVMAHGEFIKNEKLKKENGDERKRVNAEEVIDFFTANMDTIFNGTLQAGGNATIGKGLMKTIILT